MKFLIKDFFSTWDHIRSKLRIWAHLLKKSSIENLSFCVVGMRWSDVKVLCVFEKATVIANRP